MRVLLLLLFVGLLDAQNPQILNPEVLNPQDLNFHLRLTKESPQYSPSEPITFEIALSSAAEKKYYATWTSLIPRSGVHLNLDPQSNAVDLLAERESFIGSVLSSEGYLTPEAMRETGDLTQWYRFQKPGHYSLSIAVDWVSRMEGGVKTRIPLVSNTVDLDIVSTSLASADAELETILNQIDDPRNINDRQEPLRRLDLMQTPAATLAKVTRFLLPPTAAYNEYYQLLLHSGNLDVAIPALEKALENPSLDPPSGLVDLLATLRVRQEAGDAPALDLRERYLAEYTARLLATLRKRSGPERTNVIFQAWSQAARHYPSSNDVPTTLIPLESEVLSLSAELSAEQQEQFVLAEWSRLPHVDLLPLIRSVTALTSGASDEILKHWCEDWPDDCSKAIIARTLKPGSMVSLESIHLIPETEHPEYDAFLQAGLPKNQPQITALIARVGSRNIKPAVESLLNAPQIPNHSNCQSDGYLYAYLLRLAPKETVVKLRPLLQDPDPSCTTQILRGLNYASNVEPVIPLLLEALDSPNLNTAASASLFLAERAPASVRAALAKRLQTLHLQWQNHAAIIASAGMADGITYQIARLEQSLVCALSHAKAWTLSQQEMESLQAACFTETCRQMALGQSWFIF